MRKKKKGKKEYRKGIESEERKTNCDKENYEKGANKESEKKKVRDLPRCVEFDKNVFGVVHDDVIERLSLGNYDGSGSIFR